MLDAKQVPNAKNPTSRARQMGFIGHKGQKSWKTLQSLFISGFFGQVKVFKPLQTSKKATAHKQPRTELFLNLKLKKTLNDRN